MKGNAMPLARWRTLLAAVLACALAPAAGEAGDFDGFRELVDSASLKPFTRDLGSVLGAATFHSGRSLGFSGFDVGARAGVQLRPSGGNAVLRGRGVKVFGLPWVQAEIGLPFQFDGYIRGVSFQGLTIAGGGLRYGILKQNDQPLSPQFLLAASGHSAVHQDFAASHFGGNFIASLTYKILTPYLGAGVDRTRVVVRTIPAREASLEGASATTTETRFTAGASVRPKPYLYLHGAYTLTHGQSGFDSGLGIRF